MAVSFRGATRRGICFFLGLLAKTDLLLFAVLGKTVKSNLRLVQALKTPKPSKGRWARVHFSCDKNPSSVKNPLYAHKRVKSSVPSKLQWLGFRLPQGAPCSVCERGAFPSLLLTNFNQYRNDSCPDAASWINIRAGLKPETGIP